MTIEIGRIVVKIAGRDAGKKAIIIDILDDKYVLLDGETRRKRCNILHIEPLNQLLKIEKDASHGDIARALKELGIEARQTKPKQKTERPLKKRKTPEQLKAQKEEKKNLRGITKSKSKEETKEKSTLEEKAGLVKQKTEEEADVKQEKPKKTVKKEE